jgi:hypothetical protein
MAVVETIRIEGETSGIENKIQKINNQVEQLVDSVEDVGTESKKSFDKMDKESKETNKTLKKTNTTLKSFIKNIKATVGLAAGLAIVKGIFSSMQFAVDAVNIAMLDLTLNMNNLKRLVTGEISFEEFLKVAETSGRVSMEIIELEKEALRAEVKRQEIQLKSQALIEKERQIRDDITQSMDVRIAANKNIAQLTKDQIEDEKKQIELQIVAAQERFKADARIENEIALRQKKLQLSELEERTTSVESERLANQNSLRSEQNALMTQQNANDAEAIELSGRKLRRYVAVDQAVMLINIREKKSLVERLIQEKEYYADSIQEQLIFIQNRLAAMLLAGETNTGEYEELLKRRFNLEQEYNQKSLDQDRDIFNARIDNIAGGFDLASQGAKAFADLSQALGENDEANAEKSFQRTKKLQLAAAIANTASAVTAQLANVPDVAGGINFVKAGIALTTGLAQIATIQNTKFEAPSTLSRPSAGSNVTAPSAPAQFNIVGQSGTNQLLEGIAGTFDRPVRAYVVAGEVLSGSQLDRQRLRTATFP